MHSSLLKQSLRKKTESMVVSFDVNLMISNIDWIVAAVAVELD